MVSFESVRAQEWRKLVPLKSTRADVEKLVGPAGESYGLVYELADGNLAVEYSTGPCRPDRGGWNVDENTLLSLHFSPKVKQRVVDFKIDRRKFKEEIDQHSNGFVRYYINNRDGIMYEVQQGEVGYVEYYPPSKDRPTQPSKRPSC
jgi:hypothetical protein